MYIIPTKGVVAGVTLLMCIGEVVVSTIGGVIGYSDRPVFHCSQCFLANVGIEFFFDET